MTPKNLLIEDNIHESQLPRYDVDPDFSPFVLAEDLSFTPISSGPCLVPLLDQSKIDVDETVVKVLLHAANEEHVSDSVENAISKAKHVFSIERDLIATTVLTGGILPEKVERLDDGTPVYEGVKFIVSDSVPKGEIVVVADPEFTGFLARRLGLVGILFTNKNAVMRFKISPN